MEQDIYKEYALLALKLEELEEKKENMRRRILEDLIMRAEDKHNTSFGTFTVANKIVWTYSPKVEKLEERLKLSRITEQKKGIAKYTEKPYLMYAPKKI